ncbi:MAG: type II toxin-antitoxin system RelE/ParE family toxin [Nanoarchaeales archaeon]|nr:type II toxin-antitoxin system RelE/ParE family toxin [Nanoarchaeales archaeon]
MNKLILLSKAKSDFGGIYYYHKSFSLNSANKIKTELRDDIKTLKKFPKLGIEHKNNFRKLPCGRYLILYKIINNSVIIHRIIDTKMNFDF